MTALERPICDSEVARNNLSREIERLGDVVQDLEARLQLVIVPSSGIGAAANGGEPKSPMRSPLAEELHARADRITSITDRIISLRQSLDL